MNRLIRTALAAAAIGLAAAPKAEALTFSLDFMNSNATDIFSVQTTAVDYSAYGFTSLSTAQIEQAIFDAVVADYLGYPTVATDGSSPLPAGKQLNMSFVMAHSIVAPGNGDTEFYHIAIGVSGTPQVFLGQACYQCVRTTGQVGPNFGVASGDIVGSILTDNIATLAGLASSDQERVNLLAGTIAHEVGHTLMLDHSGVISNPGDSAYSIMGTGAGPFNMPNGERVLDRSFAYSDMSILIDTVGITDAPVPEPGTMALFATGVLLLRLRRRA